MFLNWGNKIDQRRDPTGNKREESKLEDDLFGCQVGLKHNLKVNNFSERPGWNFLLSQLERHEMYVAYFCKTGVLFLEIHFLPKGEKSGVKEWRNGWVVITILVIVNIVLSVVIIILQQKKVYSSIKSVDWSVLLSQIIKYLIPQSKTRAVVEGIVLPLQVEWIEPEQDHHQVYDDSQRAKWSMYSSTNSHRLMDGHRYPLTIIICLGPT